MSKAELGIELEIHNRLRSMGFRSRTNDIKGYFNKEAGLFVKNTNLFIERGISDISFLHKGQYVCIEVKKPSEMTSADKSLEDLKQEYVLSQVRGQSKATQKKKKHRFEQRFFLDNIISNGGIGFFSSSVEQTRGRLDRFNFKY